MSSARLVLLLGALLLGATAQAAKPPVLRGKLLDESGKPMPGQKVFLLPGDFKLTEEAKRIVAAALATEQTDSKGGFAFDRLERRGARRRSAANRLPAGQYLVATFQEGKSEPPGLRWVSQQAVVGKKKSAEVELRYPPVAPKAEPPPEAAVAPKKEGPGLEGTVTDGSGQPLEGVGISVSQPNAELQSAQTDASGHFSLPGLLPGAAELRINGIPGSRALQVQEKVELPPKGNVRLELRISQAPKG